MNRIVQVGTKKTVNKPTQTIPTTPTVTTPTQKPTEAINNNSATQNIKGQINSLSDLLKMANCIDKIRCKEYNINCF